MVHNMRIAEYLDYKKMAVDIKEDSWPKTLFSKKTARSFFDIRKLEQGLETANILNMMTMPNQFGHLRICSEDICAFKWREITE